MDASSGLSENAETIQEGAARETLEEANARVHSLELYTLFSLPHISQVYMFYRAELSDLDFSAGEESLAVGLYARATFPGMSSPSPWLLTLSNAISLTGTMGSSRFEKGLSSH